MRHKQKMIKFLHVQNHSIYVISFLTCKNVWNKIIIFPLCRYNNTFIQEFANACLNNVRILILMHLRVKSANWSFKKNNFNAILHCIQDIPICCDFSHALICFEILPAWKFLTSSCKKNLLWLTICLICRSMCSLNSYDLCDLSWYENRVLD